jgi:polysaccharide export outer membrane protein
MAMARRTITLIALTLTLLVARSAPAAAQAAVPPPPPPSPPAADQTAVLPSAADVASYEVGPDDTLSITIFGEPDLERMYHVQPDGMIAFPFINNIKVAGLTARGVETELRKRLVAAKFYEDPQVSVEITGFRSQTVSVRGSVANPGELTLDARDMTLSRALSKAGLSPVAGSYIEIRRPIKGVEGGPVEYDTQTVQRKDLDELRIDPRLKDGDDIYVPKAPVYYMNGYVKQTGPMVWKPDITVGEAIAAAGGLAERGTFRGLKIQRLVDGEFKEFDADRNTKIQPEDQVIIKQRMF